MANVRVYGQAGAGPVEPVIRHVGLADLKEALSKGLADFMARPSHLVFLGLLYPVLGLCLAALTFSSNLLPLLFPLASGFALLGPFAAIGLYEISRRRELGQEASWRNAFDVLRSPSIPAIAALAVLLVAIFLCWLGAAQALYAGLFGSTAPESYGAFMRDVLTTPRGWTLIVAGNLIGLAFAVVILTISVVSFPLLLDRDVGAVAAIRTSVRAVAANPVAMAQWGLIVAVALALGSVPLFVGLALVVPVLGHATWHLYRRMVG